MGLWAEIKKRTAEPADEPELPGSNLEAHARDRESGLERMRQAWQRIADLWGADIELKGQGDSAWSWIKASSHWKRINQAEDLVNAVGSLGDPAALASACDSFVTAWREGIEGWKKANGSTKAEQRSFNLGQ